MTADGEAGSVDVPRPRRDSNDKLGCLGSLGCLGFFLALAVFLVAAQAASIFALVLLSDGYVALARGVTAGTPEGMAAAGWLLFTATGAVALVLVLTRGRVARVWTHALTVAVIALCTIAWYLAPLRGSKLAETVDGAGGSGFITGVRWSVPTAVLLLIIAVHVQARKRAKDFYVRNSMLRWTIGAVSVLAFAGLVVAVIRAG